MKVYLATPMNGKSIENIKENIANCASFLATKGIDFFNPFLEITAQANSIDGIVRDHRPIEMLCNSAKFIEDCDGLLFIGKMEDLKQSSGCQIETLIAVNYGKDCYIYDEGKISELDSVEMTWSFGKNKEYLS